MHSLVVLDSLPWAFEETALIDVQSSGAKEIPSDGGVAARSSGGGSPLDSNPPQGLTVLAPPSVLDRAIPESLSCQKFERWTLRTAFIADGAESQLYEVFLVVVNQGNGLASSLDTINGNAALVRRSAGLQDSDVVHRLPIPVMHLEFLPVCGETRSESQFVHLKP